MLRLTGGVGRLEGESGITLLGLPPAALVHLNGWRENESPARATSWRRGSRRRRRATALGSARACWPRVTGGPVRLFAEIETPTQRLRPRPARRPAAARRAAAGWRDRDRAGHAPDRARRGRRHRRCRRGDHRASGRAGGSATGSASAEPGSRRASGTRSRTRSRRGSGRQPTEPVPVLAPRRGSPPRPTNAACSRSRSRASASPSVSSTRCAASRASTARASSGRSPRPSTSSGPAPRGERGLAAAARAGRPRCGRACLAAKPFNVLDVQSRGALEADARRDPIAHGTLLALIVAALVALGLARRDPAHRARRPPRRARRAVRPRGAGSVAGPAARLVRLRRSRSRSPASSPAPSRGSRSPPSSPTSSG